MSDRDNNLPAATSGQVVVVTQASCDNGVPPWLQLLTAKAFKALMRVLFHPIRTAEALTRQEELKAERADLENEALRLEIKQKRAELSLKNSDPGTAKIMNSLQQVETLITFRSLEHMEQFLIASKNGDSLPRETGEELIKLAAAVKVIKDKGGSLPNEPIVTSDECSVASKQTAGKKKRKKHGSK